MIYSFCFFSALSLSRCPRVLSSIWICANKTNDIFHTINNGLYTTATTTEASNSFNVFCTGPGSHWRTNAFDAIFRLIFLDYLLLRAECRAARTTRQNWRLRRWGRWSTIIHPSFRLIHFSKNRNKEENRKGDSYCVHSPFYGPAVAIPFPCIHNNPFTWRRNSFLKWRLTLCLVNNAAMCRDVAHSFRFMFIFMCRFLAQPNSRTHSLAFVDLNLCLDFRC